MSAHSPVAVIDVGSNSGRVAVYRRDASGRLRLLASSRAALRLVRDVDRRRSLSDEAIERALAALADFRAIALGAGATRIVGVATAAMRDASNGRALLERVRRELGLTLEVIDGEAEARYGFLGGIQGLPVVDGLLFDMGGGSMQLSGFADRRLSRSWSLPLGALRLSGAFLAKDPPTRGEQRRLRRHVARLLDEARVPRLRAGEVLVGTGGTVRNLGKMDARGTRYPVGRVHGYRLEHGRLRELVARLVGTRARKRDGIPGLSGERADSIVGGALAIEALAEAVGAREILISGQGVREGLAASMFGSGVETAREVRASAVASLAHRFDGWRAETALRRAGVARALRAALQPGASAELAEALGHAATLLDIGRSVDFFDRHRHAADIVRAAEMDGFTHRDVALLAAVLLGARPRELDFAEFGPLLAKQDRAPLTRAGVLLALADDVEERCAPDSAIALRVSLARRTAAISVPALLAWRPRGLDARFEEAFGRSLRVVAGRRR
jgi:exopolyphosphatase/guanosine-5'-triphosphate,3'-diphosphate pyrophosphatase